MRERLSEEVMLSTVMKDMRECDLLASGILLVIHSNYYFQCPQEDCKTCTHIHTHQCLLFFMIIVMLLHYLMAVSCQWCIVW